MMAPPKPKATPQSTLIQIALTAVNDWNAGDRGEPSPDRPDLSVPTAEHEPGHYAASAVILDDDVRPRAFDLLRRFRPLLPQVAFEAEKPYHRCLYNEGGIVSASAFLDGYPCRLIASYSYYHQGFILSIDSHLTEPSPDAEDATPDLNRRLPPGPLPKRSEAARRGPDQQRAPRRVPGRPGRLAGLLRRIGRLLRRSRTDRD